MQKREWERERARARERARQRERASGERALARARARERATEKDRKGEFYSCTRHSAAVLCTRTRTDACTQCGHGEHAHRLAGRPRAQHTTRAHATSPIESPYTFLNPPRRASSRALPPGCPLPLLRARLPPNAHPMRALLPPPPPPLPPPTRSASASTADTAQPQLTARRPLPRLHGPAPAVSRHCAIMPVPLFVGKCSW